jgi:NAD(P)-dependent dehydrogenase (short-subunit alcohol dehydrogenase family)
MKEEFCLSFENKVALVTGVGSGMGLATPKAFAEAGASVLLADANEKLVRAAAKTRLPLATKQFPSAAMLPTTSKWPRKRKRTRSRFR